MHNTRRLVHGLELIDGALESVLHHVAKLKVLLADLVVGHAQDLLDILQSKAVALQSLEGLSTTNESLDVVGIDLQNGRAVCWVGGGNTRYDVVEIRSEHTETRAESKRSEQ